MEAEDLPYVDPEVVEYIPEPGEEDFCVVCLGCRMVQNAERVMKSSWYEAGLLPPCNACGGVCREIPTSSYNQFIKDSEAGKRFF